MRDLGETTPDHPTAYGPFADVPAAVVGDALQRVLSSRVFRRSIRHRRFLEHVVRAALAGRLADLKELVIGVEVFTRSPSGFDPRRDPIVRVEAGRIREKLARYYADEGATDPHQLQLPTGGYLPRIVRRQSSRPDAGLGSIAVLPFTHGSASGDDSLFCSGLTSQTIDALGRLPGLRVVGRLSSTNAKARNLDLRATARLLGVSRILDGNVQRSGSRRRCIVQLHRVKDGICTWSERFDDDLQDGASPFDLQDRVSAAVVAAVARSALADAPLPPTENRSMHAKARDLYERARYLVQMRKTDGLRRAIELLDQSTTLDSTYAPAYSQLALARSTLAGILALPTVPASRDIARYARQALELDPADGDARALLANIAFRVELDWLRAEPMFREALRVAPSSAIAHLNYASALVFNGRYNEGMEEASIGFDLDPLNFTLRLHVAVITAYARDFEAAVREMNAVLGLDADHDFAQIMAGSVRLWAGDADAAAFHFDRAARLAPDSPIPRFNRVMVEGLRGRRDAGRRMLDALLADLRGTRYQLYNRAMAEAYLGDTATACETLRRSAEARELLFVSTPADPSFDACRDDPAFIALMDDYRLPRLPRSPFAADSVAGS